MTQQEQQLLDGLIQRVNSTKLDTKDADAERFLVSGLGSNPDALYILCQTVLVQQFAMENSQHALATLRTRMQEMQQAAPAQSKEHGSFLGNLFGLSKSSPSAPPPPAAAPSGYQPVHDPVQAYPSQASYPPPSGYPPQGYPQYGGQPGYPPPSGYGYGGAPMSGGMFGGGGGFLAGAAQTAAGVVAGEMAFRALEDVFSSGHHGYGGFDGSREVVNNNYYDDGGGSRDGDTSSFGDRLQSADGFDNNGVSSDIEDRRGDASGFFGDGGNDSSNFADDTNVADDSGSFDDGGGSDTSSGDDSGF